MPNLSNSKYQKTDQNDQSDLKILAILQFRLVNSNSGS